MLDCAVRIHKTGNVLAGGLSAEIHDTVVAPREISKKLANPLNSERCSHAQELKNLQAQPTHTADTRLPNQQEEDAAVGGVDEVRVVTDGKDFVVEVRAARELRDPTRIQLEEYAVGFGSD